MATISNVLLELLDEYDIARITTYLEGVAAGCSDASRSPDPRVWDTMAGVLRDKTTADRNYIRAVARLCLHVADHGDVPEVHAASRTLEQMPRLLEPRGHSQLVRG
jgi:hypothetical protein